MRGAQRAAGKIANAAVRKEVEERLAGMARDAGSLRMQLRVRRVLGAGVLVDAQDELIVHSFVDPNLSPAEQKLQTAIFQKAILAMKEASVKAKASAARSSSGTGTGTGLSKRAQARKRRAGRQGRSGKQGRPGKKQRQRQPGRPTKGACWSCGKKGHQQAECPGE